MMTFNPQPEAESMRSEDRMTFYIAGPMAGRPYFNFPEFDAARDYLQRKGFNVISPADLDREVGIDPMQFDRDHDWTANALSGQELQDAIERDIVALRKCDAIYLLDGWQTSKGAQAEKAIAEWNGMEVFYQTADCEPSPQGSAVNWSFWLQAILMLSAVAAAAFDQWQIACVFALFGAGFNWSSR
jgi:hypothetical protein